jgi:hypothetical protein
MAGKVRWKKVGLVCADGNFDDIMVVPKWHRFGSAREDKTDSDDFVHFFPSVKYIGC